MADANFQVKKGITVPQGSKTSPSVIFNSQDEDTGLYSPGQDQLAVAVSGVDKVVIKNEVGINTVDPQSTLDVRASGVTTYLNVGSETAQGAVLTLDGSSNGDGLGSDYARIAHTASGVLQIKNLTANSVEVYTNDNRRFFVNGSGYFLIGGEKQRSGVDFNGASNSTEDFPLQMETAGNNTTRGLAIIHNAGTTSASLRGPQISLARTASTTVGGSGIVFNNYELGEIAFYGSDGVKLNKGCSIRGVINGTPGVGDMPGRFEILTTPSGTATPELSVRVNQDSSVHIGRDYSATSAQLHVRVPNSDTVTPVLQLEQIDAAGTDSAILVIEADAANNEITYIATGTNAGVHVFDVGNNKALEVDQGRTRIFNDAGDPCRLTPSNGVTVGAVAETIVSSAGTEGNLHIVNGVSGSDRFCDLVLASTGASPSVVQSFTALGSPAARTYTRSGSALQLAMATGSYIVNTLSIGKG